MKKQPTKFKSLPKVLTGIQGLDEITYGGLPEGRPTLVCGGAGSGKTLLGLEFIVRGAALFNEPGVIVSFEESPAELISNVASLGFDIQKFIDKKLIHIEYVYIEKSEIEITGEFDLEGLFIRLGYAIDTLGAKRILLDTLESLFSGISNHAILRAELRRLFRWLKNKGLTAVITGEKGDRTLTREGLEEYVSDCVIFLDHRINDQYGTRRLRIIKYRGSIHGTNEYPFIIRENGISVIPISSLKLDHEVSKERISSGIKSLDEMFGGKGFYRGSTILISGTAGTGKSSILAHFANASCKRGEKCLYIALEESKNQIIRNMSSIGVDLKHWEDKGILKFHITRPFYYSLEMHLAMIQNLVNEFNPRSVLIDPVTNFLNISESRESNSLLTRLIDFLKVKRITAVLTSLSIGGENLEKTDVGISSLIDTWILLRDIEINNERNRGIYILKSRGMKHSNQVREFILSSNGVELVDVFVGEDGILVGSARKEREKQYKMLGHKKKEDEKLLQRDLKNVEQFYNAKLESIKAEYESKVFEMKNKLKEINAEADTVLSKYKNSAHNRQNQTKMRKPKSNER